MFLLPHGMNAVGTSLLANGSYLQDAATLDVLRGLMHAVLDVEAVQALVLHRNDGSPAANKYKARVYGRQLQVPSF